MKIVENTYKMFGMETDQETYEELELNLFKCVEFFNKLAKLLENSHEVYGSCNQDSSCYIVPNGTADQVTYHSKPIDSFRVSDHWNWFSNLKKNPDFWYVQCYSVDAPHTRKRPTPEKASYPRRLSQVCYFGEDQRYHCVYGEYWDRKTQTYKWRESTPEQIVELMKGA